MILCRQLTPGSADADRACKFLSDNYNRLVLQVWEVGCITSVLYFIAIFLPAASNTTLPTPNLSAIYRPYLRTLIALRSPLGANVAADLAINHPNKLPADLGSEALMALPPLLNLVAASKPGELPQRDADSIIRLVNTKEVPDETKLLALKAVEAIGNQATAATVKEFDRNEWSSLLTAEVDRVMGVLAARS